MLDLPNLQTEERSMLTPNTSTKYGTVSRTAHMVGGVAVVVMLAIGLYFHEMPKGDERTYWRGLHVSLGALFLLPLLFRVGWGVLSTKPTKIVMSRAEEFLAATVQRLLLLAIVVMLVTGVWIPWSGGSDIEVFSLFALPSPMARHEGFHELLETVHGVAARALLVLVVIHVVGVIKQAFKDFQSLKGRMFL
jgi:cytochrome b561